LTTFIF